MLQYSSPELIFTNTHRSCFLTGGTVAAGKVIYRYDSANFLAMPIGDRPMPWVIFSPRIYSY